MPMARDARDLENHVYANAHNRSNSLEYFFSLDTIPAVPRPLNSEQNERVRAIAIDLVRRYGGNVSAAARASKVSQSWLHRFVSGVGGASLDSAQLLADELGRDVTEVLGISPKVTTWANLPGYESALSQAKAALKGMFDERIWYQVGRLSMPANPEVVEPW